MSHIHKDIDFTVSIFVTFENRVLLHVHTKYKIWLPPGGHIELTEDPNEAALREVKEESGLEVKLLQPRGVYLQQKERGFKSLTAPFYYNIHQVTEDDPHRHSDFVFFAKSDTDAIVPEHKGDEWRWFTKEDIESGTWEILPSVKFYALEALKAASLYN